MMDRKTLVVGQDVHIESMDTKLWVRGYEVRRADGQCVRGLYTEIVDPWSRRNEFEITPNDFLLSEQKMEIYGRLWKIKWASTLKLPVVVPYLILEAVPAPTGYVYALYLSEDECPGSDLMELTDEKLLDKLRSVNGQFTYERTPVCYYEHLMSTADYQVYAKTAKLPIRR
jgi:hypothetical protein